MGDRDLFQPSFSSGELERRIAELTILYEVSRALQRTVDEEKALYTILVGVTSGRGLGYNRAFLLLIDSDAKFLEGRMALGPSSPEEASRIWSEMRRKHQTLAGQLGSLDERDVKRGFRANEIVKGIHIPLSESDDSLVRIMRSREACRAQSRTFVPHGLAIDAQLIEDLGVDAFAVAPLYVADRELGLLIADNVVTRSPIDVTNLHLLQIYAQAASSAIQNTRLYRQLMEKIAVCERVNVTLRESQQQLLQTERLSTIGKMAALLAHEIRTPLVSIGGFARRMLRSTAPDDPRAEEMEIIVSEVHRLEKLVDEVLGYSRVSKPEYRSTDVNTLIRSVMITLQDELHKNSIRVELDLDPRLPLVEADEAQLRQVLMNLVTNAIDAMSSGGVLTLTTIFDNKFLEISVSDTGMGISEENWDKLFTPFFTTKTTGTGLGLAIVSQVVDNHKGSLRFESIPRQGTSFHIRLAIHPEYATPPDAAPNSDSVSRGAGL